MTYGNKELSEHDSKMILRCVLLRDSARIPERKTEGAAGFDVYSPVDFVITAKSMGIVPLGIAIECPHGTYCRTANRSSLARYHQLIVMADCVDADYRGEISMILYNLGEQDYRVSIGERIGQLIFERYESPLIVLVRSLGNTSRGSGRFGSTDSISSNDI